MSEKVLVYGVGVAGMATIDFLLRRQVDVIVADDSASDLKRAALEARGLEVLDNPGVAQVRDALRTVDYVAPAPGIPESHRVITEALAIGRDIKTELDIAYEWESQRAGGPRPMLAITGTDGKTTTTLMTEAILRAGKGRTIACGNTEVPLLTAIDSEVDSFVVETSSFRLAFNKSFRAVASAWMNFDADHLDWHVSMGSYEAAKARIWRNVVSTDTAIGVHGQDVVLRHLAEARCRRRVVGGSGDYRVVDRELVGPSGTIMATSALRRTLPHDLSNALVASALCLESGLADVTAVERGLSTFTTPHHRIEFIGEFAGVRWFDDSKATTPHAVVTALRGFESVVLIAGGRNKGLDLSQIAVEASRLKSVVAIGEAAEVVAQVFSGKCQVVMAQSMEHAVQLAVGASSVDDVVLLSPGCTSFDSYNSYAERGEHFATLVRQFFTDPNLDKMISSGEQ